MESVKCSNSPTESIIEHETSAKSPPTHKTPVRQNEKKRHTTFQSSLGGFTVLPTHMTPPSGLTKFIARNPFDADLTSRLHLSVISPTVFTKVPNKLSQDSPGFSWSVDEIALIQPAKIEEFPMQVHCTDPDLEIVAQAAIDRFFKENHVIPSPWDEKRKAASSIASKPEMTTPSRPLEDVNLTRESIKTKRECWTQTVLTLPPQLPKDVEEALKPYFTFNQDQNVETEDANSSNNSLRRKLFFNNDDCTEDEDEASFIMSPVKSCGSMICPNSPPHSGMLVHGTPLGRGALKMQRTYGTPCAGNISPPNMSPICNTASDMSCQSIRSHCQFAARLDFTTDMSVDVSIRDEKELKRLEDAELDTNASLLQSDFVKGGPVESSGSPCAVDETSQQNETTEMLSQEATTPIEHNDNQESSASNCKNNEILNRLKLAADWCKIYSNESLVPQNNTLLGHSVSEQQSALYSAQDTGYQTYSTSNITETTGNSSITPVKQKYHWNEKIMSTGEEIQLSDWQDNMKNMFSSTPSKYTRRRDN